MPPDSEPVRIRNYQPDDLDLVYGICLQTAYDGQDATGLFRDPQLPGHVYVAPYVIFEPSLAFVAEDAEGVGGYIVAALDSRSFDQRLEKDWWPALRARYPEPPPAQAKHLSAPERYAVHDIHHPFGGPLEVVDRYPSHLHVNLVPRMQGHGVGRQLAGTLIDTLRGRGSRGVHLIVGHSNQRAIGFYRHFGFAELIATGAHIFGMNLVDEGTARWLASKPPDYSHNAQRCGH